MPGVIAETLARDRAAWNRLAKFFKRGQPEKHVYDEYKAIFDVGWQASTDHWCARVSQLETENKTLRVILANKKTQP